MKKNKVDIDRQNSIWNRWLGSFLLFVILGTTCLIAGILSVNNDLLSIGLSFALRPVVKSGGYYFLLGSIFYFIGYWVWKGR